MARVRGCGLQTLVALRCPDNTAYRVRVCRTLYASSEHGVLVAADMFAEVILAKLLSRYAVTVWPKPCASGWGTVAMAGISNTADALLQAIGHSRC